MNYQHWYGVDDPRFGYGSMLKGFLDHLPSDVELNDKASVSVHMGVPFSPSGWWDGQHRVVFTMWETDTLPANFRHWLPLYDQVLVPCQHNLDLFSKHHDNVQYVPLGVDTKFWKPIKKPQHEGFRFHAGGSLWRRKGLDVVVKAFNSLKLPDATLHIKAAPHARDVPAGSLGPNIHLHREWMSLKEQRDWYNLGDVFIAASRGEGFGLMPLQAIAMGIPTIVSNSTGQDQFSHLATGVVTCGKSKAETVGLWDEPNFEELRSTMLDHYRNYQAKQEKAAELQKGTADWTWGSATNKLVAALPAGKLLKTDTFVPATPAIWVRLNRDLKCHIHKTDYVFKKGEDYNISEGVYQVLSDAGYIESEFV